MSEREDSKIFLIEFWSLLLDGRISIISKIVCLGFIVIYAVSPIDLIPDILLPVGIVDDGGIILSVAYLFVRNARQQLESDSAMSQDEQLRKHNFRGDKSSGMVQVMLGCFGLIGAMVLGMVVLFVTGTLTIGALFSSIGNFFGQPDMARITTSRTLVNSLQPLGQLVSIQVEVAQADIGVEVNTGGLNLCGHSANHVAQGVIEAGIDITKVEVDNIQYNPLTNAYTLTLPAPTITSCRIEYIRQYERSGSNPTCGTDWDTVRLLAQYEATKLFASDTIEAGILSRAEHETTILMQSFVGALTGSEVNIIYAEITSENQLPTSCNPQLPRGWSFDEETQMWIQGD